ncbi:MAG: dimethyladenosine transferase [Actinomycetota bacterium]|nr:dimethyladenosine transferase [Acidimicrobiaceae bacterium]MEC7915034.1 dimethyladenosine transferase [Actinomycetota bacterium]MEC9059698.1 dimethyladenosine transferase [Actinomycetota bacterium]MEC9474221.1 dimethyladenosine transferase [Actinomycetota bacterium]MEE3256026.1 dimethyladenosine transferase [Actinomycetota bacterium]
MARRVVSCERLISADASVIFDVLTDPSQHAAIDGSNTVQGHVGKQERLSLGSTFAMRMRLGVPYRIKSRVFEFAENRLIAWGHFGGHRWRYELRPVEERTLVVESFDWSTSRVPLLIELVGYPRRHKKNMERTLFRLAGLVESS